ncbi:MAG: hypothetical protein ACYS7Y_27880 [Planctomycetota bacterium]|jgi:hypothetical protein
MDRRHTRIHSAGVEVDRVDIQIYAMPSPLSNEGFDQCGKLISRSQTATIRDGCYDRFDGDIDGEDSDCPANG